MGLNPIARTLKTTTGGGDPFYYRQSLQHTAVRPATWALKGKATTKSTFPYKGGIEGTKTKTGGGLTRRGGAAVAAAGTGGGALALKTKKKVEKNMSDPFEVSKGQLIQLASSRAGKAAMVGGAVGLGEGAAVLRIKHRKKNLAKSAFGVDHELSKAEKGPFRRPSFQNTRKENTKVGATVGAGAWGGLGAVSGASVGAHQAKRGIKVLDEVGAHPGRLRAAKLVAGHAGKTGAALGAAGAVSGAAVGGLVGAMEGAKGGKYGEQDRKYAIQAAKMRADRLERKAAKSRANSASFSKSAFGVDH